MSKQIFTINEAAARLHVSAKTLRRWEIKGIITPKRSLGNQRLYTLADIKMLEEQHNPSPVLKQQKTVADPNFFTINEAAARLHVSAKTLRRWETKGIITPKRSLGNQRRYTLSQILMLEEQHLPFSLAEETTEIAASPKSETTQEEIVAPSLPKPTFPPVPLPTPNFIPLREKIDMPLPVAAQKPKTSEILIHFSRPAFASHFSSRMAFLSLGGFFIVSALTASLLAINYSDLSAEQLKGILAGIPYLNTSKAKDVDQDVLQSTTARRDLALRISIPVEILSTASVSGNLTAPNILYSILPGDNIAISGDPQNPTISATVEDLEDFGFVAGEGIAFDGTTITNTAPGTEQNIFANIKVGSTTISAGSNTDTLELAAGSNITLSTDTSNKKVTISASGGSSDGIDGIEVLEGGTTVSDTITSLDFLGGDFDVGESPSGEANISLASTLTSVTGVSGNFSIGGTTTLNGLTYSWPGSQTASYVLQTNGSGTLSWVDPGTLPTSDDWDTLNGAIVPKITTQDLLIGGTATTSAKFAVLNVNSGSPTASLSAGIAGGAYLTAAGTLQTTAFQTLNLGGDTTGNISLSPKNGSGNLALTANALTINGSTGATSASPTCVSVTNGIVTGSGACGAGSGGSIWTLNTTNGTISPINNTMDLLIGGIATSSARFAALNINSGTPTASVSAGTAGGSYLTAAGRLQTTAFQTLNLGGDSTGDISLSPKNGTGTLALSLGTLTINGNTAETSVTPTCVSFTNGIITGSAACGPGQGGSVWTFNTTDGTLYPINNTMDFFLGGPATTSAKFAVLNLAGGTPIASISAGVPGGAYLTAAGRLQTTAFQTLNLGGDSTGDISLSPKNGSGNLFLNANALQINSNPGSTLVSPTCVTTTNGIVTGTGTCSLGAGGSVWTFASGIGALYPINATMDFLIGGVSSSSAAFHVYGAANSQGTNPVASIAANTSAAGLVVDNRGSGDLFTASSSGLNRFVIKQNGNVGIGTNLPGQQLDVVGTAQVKDTLSPTKAYRFRTSGGALDFEGGGADMYFSVWSDAAFAATQRTYMVLSSTGQQGTMFGAWNFDTAPFGSTRHTISGATGGNVIFNDNAEATNVTIEGDTDTALFVTDGTNDRIGLGTSSPLAKLDVRGGTGLNSGTIPVASVSANTSFAALVTDNRGSGDIFTASSSGLPRFTIKQNGDLQIGSLTYTFPSSLSNGYILQTNASGSLSWIDPGSLPNADKWDTITGAIFPKITTQDFLLGGTSSSSALFRVTGDARLAGTKSVASVSANTSFAGLVVDNRGSGDLFTASSSGLTRFVIKDNGNVGIGTANNPTSQFQIGFDNQPILMGVEYLGGDALWEGGVSNDLVIRSLANNDSEGIFFQNEVVAGGGNPYDTMAILKTGAVGIGTTSPLAGLDIRGNLANNSLAGTQPTASVAGQTSFAAMVIDNSGTGDIFTASSSGLNRFVIKQNGNVGIGTTTPSQMLDITGGALEVTGNTATAIADTFTGTTQQSYIHFPDISGSNDPGFIMFETQGSGDTNEGVLHLSPSDDNAYGDYVSIHGTNDADVLKLHTNGTIEGILNASASGTFNFIGSTDPKINILNGENFGISTSPGGDAGLTERFTILNNGNVGIGITNPDEILDINGDIQIPDGSNIWIGNNADSGERLRLHHTSTQAYIDYASADLNVRAETSTNVTFQDSANGSNITLQARGANEGGQIEFAEGTSEPSDDTWFIDSGVTAGNDPDFRVIEEGSVRVYIDDDTAGGWTTASDSRLKTNIQTLDHVLDRLQLTRGVTFDFINNETHGIGVIAQEMRAAFPELVVGDEATGYLGVTYAELSSVAIQGVKELDARTRLSTNSEIFEGLSLNANGDLAIDAGEVQTYALNVSGDITANNLTLGGQNLNDRLIGLENGFASASAGFVAPLQTQLASLNSQLSSLTSRVASLEASLAFLNSASGSGGLALQSFSVGGFTASSSAELSLDSLEVNGNILTDSLNVLGYTTMNELSVTGSIRTGVLTIKGQSNGGASISTLNGNLRLQDEGFGGIDILDGLVTIDTSGNITTVGEITTKVINTEKINITQSASGNQSTLAASVGIATIQDGALSIDIDTTALTPNSVIFVTPARPVVIGADRKDSNTFTIKLQQAQTTDLKVNWWVVN